MNHEKSYFFAIKYVAVWLAAILVLCLYGCSIKNLKKDETTHFKGIAWGESHQNIENFIIIPNSYTTHQAKTATNDYIKGFRSNERLLFADVKVDKIEYLFKRDRFYEVHIEGRGFTNFIRMISYFETKYGEPKIQNEGSNIYMWITPDIGITARYFKMSERMRIVFSYLPIKYDRPPKSKG